MSEVNFGADLEAAEKEFNLGKGSDKFKFKEGENRLPILSPSAALQNTYTNPKTGESSTNVKFLTFAWDYAESALKLAFLPVTIFRAIANLQSKPDFAFTEVPMPYDLLIDAKNAGTKEVEYTVTAARTNSEVPQAALDALSKQKPIIEVRDLIAKGQTDRIFGLIPPTKAPSPLLAHFPVTP
jgi:hypothetical protein